MEGKEGFGAKLLLLFEGPVDRLRLAPTLLRHRRRRRVVVVVTSQVRTVLLSKRKTCR